MEGIHQLHSLKQAELEAEQARQNAQQTRLTTEQVQELNKQTTLAREHADETARQGKETARQEKTILMFTVVTIIFFMADFFAINLDAFSVNENGKLPIPFVLKYMLSISGALSIPFVVVAFQQERISSWFKKFWWVQVLIWIGAVVLMFVPIALVLIAATFGAGYVVHTAVNASRDTGSTGSSSWSLADD